MKNLGIVVGSFHKAYGEEMVDEAKKAAEALGYAVTDVVWVPGSIEKPLALKRLLLRDDIQACVALGIIEKGETQHGLVMGQAVTDAIIALQLETMKPIGLGILGPGIMPSQIPARVRPYAKAAVDAVVMMVGE